jgi:KUP system potassium uptake protein
LALGAIGVVYGDIGTSPLYALKECFHVLGHGSTSHDNVLGLLSLFFWSLTCVIVVKYLMFVLRADNHGEGGILALLALLLPKDMHGKKSFGLIVLIMLGLFGAALLYGDGVITPAISVLSAVEGINVATRSFQHYVVPITCVILTGLFFMQSHGTHRVGRVFGPVMILWFLAISATGIRWIVKKPEILKAVNPMYAVEFFIAHGMHGFLILGSVVLCVTGGEALYADMGHFGRRPIRVAWFGLVFPALLLNYFGQGAYVLSEGAEAAREPFYGLLSGTSLVYPMVVLSTVAAIIASQALISGAFSITAQAVQLGYSPRVSIVHTSGEQEGQIYIPEVNALLWFTCLALVLALQTSSALASAYGIAVTGTMTITSLLFFAVMRHRWGMFRTLLLVAFFLVFDLAFFGANIPKIGHGGWFPLALGAVIFTVMTTWKVGRNALFHYIVSKTMPLSQFMDEIKESPPARVKGTGVFMTSNPDGAPPVLLHHVKHNKVLHEHVILLSIVTDRVPEVAPEDRIFAKDLGDGIHHVTARYGFMQTPSVREVLARCAERDFATSVATATFYLGRETLLTDGHSGMMKWRKVLFAFLSRNARPATHFFGIPPDHVVEIGMQIQL